MHKVNDDFAFSEFHGLLGHLLIHEMESDFRKKIDQLNKLQEDGVAEIQFSSQGSALIYDLGQLTEGYWQGLMMATAMLDRAGLISIERVIDSARNSCGASEATIRRFNKHFEERLKHLETMSPIPDMKAILHAFQASAQANHPTQTPEPESKPTGEPGPSTGNAGGNGPDDFGGSDFPTGGFSDWPRKPPE
jgi:hypothetical protein